MVESTMMCGQCLINFNSYLKLQHHKAQVHGEKNQMSRYTSTKAYQSSIDRKDSLAAAEERLKNEISRYRQNNG